MATSFVFSSVAQAQSLPDAGSLRQQIERDRLPILPGRVAPERPAEPVVMKPLSDEAIVVTAFRFTGNTLFSADQLAAAVATYLNRPLKFTDLQEAAAAIAGVYRKAGWVVRALLPDQDIKDGVVIIQIVEAIFGGVKPEGEKSSRIKLEQIIDIVEAQQQTDTLLNADAIDRALLIAGDLPGITVTGSLRQGEHKGESDLAITVVDKSLFTGDATVDNTGSRGTGPQRLAVNVGLASALGLGEQININRSHTDGSDYLRIGATAPIGNRGWRIGANKSHLDYMLVAPEMLALNSRGSSDSFGLEATYPLVRTRLDNLYFTANYDRKTFNNLANGTVTTRYQADTLALLLNGNLFDNLGGGGTNTASLSLAKGDINLDGSPNQSADAITTQTAGSFTKLRYALSRQQVISAELAFFASLSGQYASKNLDSSEKFTLGGSSAVRAYPSGEGGGALAQLFNFELRWRLPQGLSFTGFYDVGKIAVNRNNDFSGAPTLNDFILRGVGGTLAWSSANGATLKATWAHRIGHNPNPTNTGQDQDGSLVKGRWWLSVSLPF
ncbi:MAG: ShlB/FhaC/HecB family hemolysin secretion/activation protein [Burkholderiaceae bacterium]